MKAGLVALVAIVISLQGCGAPDDTSRVSDDTSAAASRWSAIASLADTGLYSDFGAKTLAPDVKLYRPAFQLYSDGLEKARFISLPAGTQIDSSEMDFWKFPNGTRLWKEFAQQDPATGELVRIETRLLERADDGAWIYGTYRWGSDQSSATLADQSGEFGVAEIAPGVTHDLPPMTDCQYCHENGNATVLGFSALQLGERSEHERGAEEASLTSLVASQSLTQAPTEEIVVRAASPLERDIVGYLHANCSHCHNPNAHGIGVSLNYAYSTSTIHERNDLPLLRDVNRPVDTPGIFIPGVFGFDQKLIDLETPSHGMMVFRMEGAESPDRMPRLGTKIRDQAFIDKLKTWILEQ